MTSCKHHSSSILQKFEPDHESDSEEEATSLSAPSKQHTYILPQSDDETEEAAGNLDQPEFEGLWDQHKPYTVPKDVESGPKMPGASKMDKVRAE